MCSPQEQCVDYKCRPRGETLHCVLAKHNINNLFLAMDCTCGVEAVNRRNVYRMVGNEREKITQVYLTFYKSSMMRPTSNIPHNNNKHESEQPKTSKKFIAKNYKTSPSLTEPYQAFLAIDVKMSLSIFIYHGVRMSLYAVDLF